MRLTAKYERAFFLILYISELAHRDERAIRKGNEITKFFVDNKVDVIISGKGYSAMEGINNSIELAKYTDKRRLAG